MLGQEVIMGYENGRAGKTGRLGEKEAIQFLDSHGYTAVKPAGKDVGVDLLINQIENPTIIAKAQVKGRRQLANPRWFQLSITPSKIKNAWDSGEPLDSLWKNKIRMVDFWILVSIPLNEVWVIPSDKVMEIAELNSKKYSSRIDNQYEKPSYTKHGKIAKKQKELNLDIEVDGIPIWKRYIIYKNNVNSLREYFKSLKMP